MLRAVLRRGSARVAGRGACRRYRGGSDAMKRAGVRCGVRGVRAPGVRWKGPCLGRALWEGSSAVSSVTAALQRCDALPKRSLGFYNSNCTFWEIRL